MKKSNKWLGILILILIIGPVVGIFYFSSIGLGGIAGSMFGLYFLIFGIISIINSHKRDFKIVEGIFILVGLVIIAIGIVNQFGTKQIVEFINTIGISLLFAFFCMGIGIGMIIGPRIYEQKALKRCKNRVWAECIDMNTMPNGYRINASPVWKYIVNGKEYTYCNEIYDLFSEDIYEEYKKEMIGTTCELFVNPRDPMDVYKEIPDGFKKGMTFIGICCLVGAGSIILSFLFL